MCTDKAVQLGKAMLPTSLSCTNHQTLKALSLKQTHMQNTALFDWQFKWKSMCQSVRALWIQKWFMWKNFSFGLQIFTQAWATLCARFCLCQWRVGDCQRLRRHRASAKRTSHWRGPRQGDWVLPNRAKWLASSWPPIATVCTPWGLPSKRQ